MLGSQSFSIQEELFSDPAKYEVFYRPSHFAKWGSVIAFSGTISEGFRVQFRTDFPNALSFACPSFRENGSSQEVTNVIKLEGVLTEELGKNIKEIQEKFINVIIIFEDTPTLLQFQLALSKIKGKKYTVYPFYQFEKDFAQTLTRMKELLTDNWVVLITKEGSRGADFKGSIPAHVIITYNPSSYSDCVQALGRGSRNLNQGSSGTIIS
mmetsp:Transcript_725/g.405  ORF Transcript_725/g.405 Transcript_725/m.405 type:complete len:210 (-) Transcript_725:370-999(-)|eukprot:CAMPEP_0202969640 /NCGR_PEP_ID=MMETSP1396-20130829/15464_1 /ASSEMBLY_ACC=CAM_ASM_000872 /TAXON_ID= /ORGANISM="Pseudokeronopsis sp., Strain Brazil" /LENGTH=209 /DNA_ID=CAMNT_0049697443 /DNA_START=1592 /DNA_END=2221 /DNA_ORIENTATION=+